MAPTRASKKPCEKFLRVRAGWQGKPRLLAAITPNTLRINLNILTSRVFGEQNLKGYTHEDSSGKR